ncbi:MAG TPA: CotH kinase family protein, partial [Polyangiaceae bacterium]|nr:CotH kinase family protein [Polyangiaceae bacterium]
TTALGGSNQMMQQPGLAITALAVWSVITACSSSGANPAEAATGSTTEPDGTSETTESKGGTSTTIAGGSGGKRSASTLGGRSSAAGGNGGTRSATVGGKSSTLQGGQGNLGGSSDASGGSGTSAELAKSQCAGNPGPSYDDFFDNQKLATLRITIDAADLGGKTAMDVLWAKKSHCEPFSYTKAKFDYESSDGAGDVSCANVGMRLRGSRGTESNQIQGFKLDLQVLDTTATVHRRFADLNRINVLSIEGDKSHMIQCLAYKAMRDFGIPAPRCNHLKVYLNDKYYGLVENVEQVNRGYVRRHFGSNEGFLFAASPSMDTCGFKDSLAKLNYSGDSFSSYTAQYLLDSATAADAEATLIPMLKCGDATQTPDEAKFKACIAEWIDVEEWLKVIAAESLMPELESWIGFYRNYYLYFNPDASAPHSGRFVAWVWDLDTAYQRNSCFPSSCDPFTSVDSLYGPRNARSKFVTRLTAAFKNQYCTQLKDFLSKVYSTSLVDDMARVIESGISGDASVSAAEWQAEVSTIRNYISKHKAEAQSTVNAACP